METLSMARLSRVAPTVPFVPAICMLSKVEFEMVVAGGEVRAVAEIGIITNMAKNMARNRVNRFMLPPFSFRKVGVWSFHETSACCFICLLINQPVDDENLLLVNLLSLVGCNEPSVDKKCIYNKIIP